MGITLQGARALKSVKSRSMKLIATKDSIKRRRQTYRGATFAITAAVTAALLSACNPSEPAAPNASLSATTSSASLSKSSPLSSPLAKLGVLSFTQPSAGKGGITGRLVSKLNGYETPYIGGDLYLGSFLAADKPDAPPVVAFSVEIDPKAVVYQADGQFAFTNIQPGTYTLIVWNPENSFVVEQPGIGAVKVVVEADKVIELGTIAIP
jgi:hypothetical protein